MLYAPQGTTTLHGSMAGGTATKFEEVFLLHTADGGEYYVANQIYRMVG